MQPQQKRYSQFPGDSSEALNTLKTTDKIQLNSQDRAYLAEEEAADYISGQLSSWRFPPLHGSSTSRPTPEFLPDTRDAAGTKPGPGQPA